MNAVKAVPGLEEVIPGVSPNKVTATLELPAEPVLDKIVLKQDDDVHPFVEFLVNITCTKACFLAH